MKKLLALAASHAVAILVGIMLLWQFGGSLVNWRKTQKLETQPVVLEQTKAAKKAKRHRLTQEQAAALCSGLTPIVRPFTAKVPQKPVPVAGIIDDNHEKIPALLDSLEIQKLPYGGRADVELSVGAARPVVTVYPNERAWVEGFSRWRLSALVGAEVWAEGDRSSGVQVVPSVEWRGLRLGRADFGAGVTFCPSRSVIAGGRVGFE